MDRPSHVYIAKEQCKGNGNDYLSILGVFATEELAQQAIENRKLRLPEPEWGEVDEPTNHWYYLDKYNLHYELPDWFK